MYFIDRKHNISIWRYISKYWYFVGLNEIEIKI